MRSSAIADDDHICRSPSRAGLGNQAAAGETFVIGMRCDDDKAAASKSLIESGEREGMSCAKNLTRSRHHRHTSNMGASRSSSHAAAFVRARSGPGWRR
jgi:hypothetical protein